MRLAGLIVITAVNLWGIAESARVLMLPMVIFLAAIFGVIVIGLVRSHPAAIVGTTQPVRVSEAVGVILILKAFAAGCSALTGIEAIANGMPVFRLPRARRAQRTELMLGALLGAMLIGLSVLIRREYVAPRGGVTVLAQLTAGSFGTGWVYYTASIAATIVFVATKFTAGAWVVVLIVPALMLLFSRIQNYYRAVGLELDLGRLPHRPQPASSLVIVPVGAISKLTERALQAALSLGDEVIAVSVHPEVGQGAAFRAGWDRWNPGVRLDTLDSPHRSLVHPIVGYVRRAQQPGRQVAVLITEVQPRRWRYRILQNQRGLLLATVLRASTDAVIRTVPYRLTSR